MNNKNKPSVIRRINFNLIEICLAIAVIAVGMSSITTLLMSSLQVNRDSVANTYCIEAINYTMAVVNTAAAMDADWKNGIEVDPAALGLSINDINNEPMLSGTGTIPASNVDLVANPDAIVAGTPPQKTNSNIQGSKMVSVANGVWRIKQTSLNNTVLDFEADVKIILSPVNIRAVVTTVTDGVENTAVENQVINDFDYTDLTGTARRAGRITAEISWPVTKPYADRTKKYFIREIFR